MKLRNPLLFNIVLAIVSFCLIFFLSQKTLLKRLELLTLDFFFHLRGTLPYTPRIVLVEITDEDIAQVGRWPWKRSWHAAMTKALTGLGARAIYFDILFSESSTEEDDALFEEAIKESKNVYLPFAFQESSTDKENVILPLPRFAANIKGTGALNIYPDDDGILRRLPLFFPEKENLSSHIALKIAMDFLGLKIKAIHPDSLLLTDTGKDTKIPLIDRNKMLINWCGRWKNTFIHYSFLDVVAGYKDFLENKPSSINVQDFKDSICVVGISSVGLFDIKPVPLEPAYPGMGIVATAMSNILDKNFISDAPAWVNLLIVFFLCLLPAFIITGERPLREALYIVFIIVLYFYLSLFLFKYRIWVHFAAIVLGFTASYLAIETHNFFRVSSERRSFFRLSVTDGLTGLYNIRYFKILLDAELFSAKSDPDKKFVIIMCDVDHFKHFNDTYGHQAGDVVLKEVAAVLKSSVRTSDLVARYGGEEMILLLRGTDVDNGLNVAEKVRKNVEAHPIKDQSNTYQVAISLGVSAFKPTDDADSIIKRADEGLYKSKQEGRNRVSTIEGTLPKAAP